MRRASVVLLALAGGCLVEPALVDLLEGATIAPGEALEIAWYRGPGPLHGFTCDALEVSPWPPSPVFKSPTCVLGAGEPTTLGVAALATAPVGLVVTCEITRSFTVDRVEIEIIGE